MLLPFSTLKGRPLMQQNTQSPEKRTRTSSSFQIHSIFSTIQGEGPFAGRPATFIRLAGCNLQCPSCDTEYTSNRKVLTPEEIRDIMLAEGHIAPLVVITGGEPFRQPIAPLVYYLLHNRYRVQIETNGTLFDPGMIFVREYVPLLQTIVCSPKTGDLNKQLVPYIDAFKYVLQAGEISEVDGLPLKALGHPCGKTGVYRPPEGYSKNRVYVQPLDEGCPTRNKQNLEAAVWSSQTFGYTFCLQVHKYINLP